MATLHAQSELMLTLFGTCAGSEVFGRVSHLPAGEPVGGGRQAGAGVHVLAVTGITCVVQDQDGDRDGADQGTAALRAHACAWLPSPAPS